MPFKYPRSLNLMNENLLLQMLDLTFVFKVCIFNIFLIWWPSQVELPTYSWPISIMYIFLTLHNYNRLVVAYCTSLFTLIISYNQKHIVTTMWYFVCYESSYLTLFYKLSMDVQGKHFKLPFHVLDFVPIFVNFY